MGKGRKKRGGGCVRRKGVRKGGGQCGRSERDWWDER